MKPLQNVLIWISPIALFIFIPFLLSSSEGEEKTFRFNFTSTPVPLNAGEALEPYTESIIRIFYPDGSIHEVPLSYHSLFKSGDIIGGGNPAGAIVDKTGRVIEDWNRSFEGEFIRRGPVHASGPDGNTLIRIPFDSNNKPANNTLHLITHFEHHTWVENRNADRPPVNAGSGLPMVMNLTLLKQDSRSGHLKPLKLENIDASTIGGVWHPCASTLTPWNTHLGSEEYEPDAKWYEHRPFAPMNLFLNSPKKLARQGGANPYQYGFPVEVIPAADGTVKVTRRFAMGRVSLEMAEIMPDRKTVYITDDAIDGVRLMFIADQAGDLSAGTLYAAEWIQSRKGEGKQARLNWIRLGHSNERAVLQLINDGTVFSDIFEEAPFFFSIRDKSLFSDFQPIYVFHGYKDVSNKIYSFPNIIHTGGVSGPAQNYSPILKGPHRKAEFLKVKPGMETAAAFLETRRFAALKGATTEFTKLEGQAINKRDKKLYTAVSSAKEGMVVGSNHKRFQNHIQFTGKPEDLYCGIVFESDLKGNMEDSEGNLIDSDWVAVNMKPLLEGKASNNKGEVCDWNFIANPDNIEFSETMRTLFIAEDSSGSHPADFLWAYSLDSGALSRILVSPKNSELTGLQVTEDYNGFTYILGNFQKSLHSEEILQHQTPRKANAFIASQDVRGIVGYLEPIPLSPHRVD